jgi:hypothetical protein
MRTSSTAARRASASRKGANNAGVDARPSGGVSLMRTLWIGWMAFGLAVVVGVVPASLAQDPQVLDLGKPAGTGVGAERPQTHGELSGGLRSEARTHTGVFIVAPIGKVRVGPASVEGEPSYVRRTTDKGITIVEVSTTPFMPVVPGGQALALIGRPDQPAGW